MKLKLLFVIFSLSFNLVTAQDTFDPNTGVFTYTYDPCKDPCSGATKADCERYANRAECRKQCDLQPFTDKEWLACIHRCNKPVTVVRRPVSFVAVFIVTTNISDQSKWQIYEIPLQDSSLPTFKIDTKMIWSEVNYYCYAYAIRILYDDGTQCDHGSKSWNCNA